MYIRYKIYICFFFLFSFFSFFLPALKKLGVGWPHTTQNRLSAFSAIEIHTYVQKPHHTKLPKMLDKVGEHMGQASNDK